MDALTSHPTTSRTFRDATRLLTSLLAPTEKRVLLWLAARMPRWVHSDHLTALALVAMAGAGLSYAAAPSLPMALLLVPIWLAINWFGDSLDGTLARVRDQQRPRYGFYVDHVVDLFGTAFLLVGMGASGLMTPAVAALLLIAYLMLCVEVFLATHTVGTFRMSYFRVGPTELRLIIAAGTVYAWGHPTAHVLGRDALVFDISGVVAACGLVVTLIASAVSNTRLLYREEPMPERRA